MLDRLVQTPVAKALGWTLFHSLWEGALAALVLLAILLAVRSPRVRYACACVAMLGVLAGFVVTFSRLVPRQMAAGASLPGVIPWPLLDQGQSSGNLPAPSGLAEILPWLAPFWIAGVFLFQLRSVAAWMGARRLRCRGVCNAPGPWQQRLDRLRAGLRLSKPVVLLESCLADVPLVIGYLRPVVLLPVGLLAGMPPGQVEAILLHELAHIRRHDYLVNLLQSVVESFLFYHPAVWWMSRVIRAEREKCCDDLTVATSANAHDYAAALAALEQTRCRAAEAALAATGGSLVKRIRRLLYQPKGSAFAPLFSAAILTIAAVGVLAAWQARTPAPAPAPESKVSRYTKWLREDVVYIINDRERAAFLSLRTDEERDHFIEQFWARRDPTPGTPENEFKEEHYRRIAFANKHFAWHSVPGWKTDRGRIYIMFGPPDEIENHPESRPAGDGLPAAKYPVEQWLYRHIKDVGDRVIVEFDDTSRTGDFRMTKDPNPKGGRLVRP